MFWYGEGETCLFIWESNACKQCLIPARVCFGREYHNIAIIEACVAGIASWIMHHIYQPMPNDRERHANYAAMDRWHKTYSTVLTNVNNPWRLILACCSGKMQRLRADAREETEKQAELANYCRSIRCIQYRIGPNQFEIENRFVHMEPVCLTKCFDAPNSYCIVCWRWKQ